MSHPTGEPPLPALLRHFEDLRDGRYGTVAVSRAAKEAVFTEAVTLLAPHARQVLDEFNTGLLLGSGTIEHTGPARDDRGGLAAAWTLSWPEQQAAGVSPITLEAHFGAEFHHPHLHGATVGEWPLNVFDDAQAAAEVPVMRAIAAADLHNLVFQTDYRIVPAAVR